jgi:hypothetical protein
VYRNETKPTKKKQEKDKFKETLCNMAPHQTHLHLNAPRELRALKDGNVGREIDQSRGSLDFCDVLAPSSGSAFAGLATTYAEREGIGGTFLHTSHQTRPFRSSSDDHQFLKREVFGKV